MPIFGPTTGKALLLWLAAAALGVATSHAGFTSGAAAQEAAVPYRNMPKIAPTGARIPKYIEVPGRRQGPPVDPAKGYRIETLGKDLYMVTENVYQAMFLVYENGVVVADAPPTLAAAIPKAIAEVTDKPITHLIYSHSHIDHIGGAGTLGGQPIIVAHEETRKTLARANDPRRPVPTVTFTDQYVLNVGSHRLELTYHGNGHAPGNIFIYAPAKRRHGGRCHLPGLDDVASLQLRRTFPGSPPSRKDQSRSTLKPLFPVTLRAAAQRRTSSCRASFSMTSRRLRARPCSRQRSARSSTRATSPTRLRSSAITSTGSLSSV